MAPVEGPVLRALGLPTRGSVLSVGFGNGAREALKTHMVRLDPEVDTDVDTRLPEILRRAGLVDLRTAKASLRTGGSTSPSAPEVDHADVLRVLDFLRCWKTPEQAARTENWLADPDARGSWNLLIASGRVP